MCCFVFYFHLMPIEKRMDWLAFVILSRKDNARTRSISNSECLRLAEISRSASRCTRKSTAIAASLS